MAIKLWLFFLQGKHMKFENETEDRSQKTEDTLCELYVLCR